MFRHLVARIVMVFLLVTLLSGCVATALNVASGFGPKSKDRGITYGSDQRQRYDIYRPKADPIDAPVIVFFYGGSWDSGKREDYRFVGNALADAGFLTVIADYRIYPRVRFPAFLEDGAKTVAAVKRNVAPHRPVFLMGHSAGAQIAALLALDSRYLSAQGLSPCRAVAGLIGLSGPYDFLPLREERYKRIFSPALRQRSQPINFAKGRHPPALLVHGAEDAIVHDEDTRLLTAALRRSGNNVTMRIYPGVDHVRTIGGIAPVLKNIAPVREDVFRFVRRQRAAGYPGCR